MKSQSARYHIALSNYFATQVHFNDGDNQKKTNIRKSVELPWQQTKAELWDEVTETLCDLEFIQSKSCAKLTFDLVNDYQFVLDGLPEYQPDKEKACKHLVRLEKYTKDLIAYTKGAIKELNIPESITPRTEEQIEEEMDRIKTNPTRADKLKDFINFLGQEADNLQRYACELANFTVQQAWNWADSGPVGNAAENYNFNVIGRLLLHKRSTRNLWNPLPHIINRLKLHKGLPVSIDMTPDGHYAISAAKHHEMSAAKHDSSVIMWNLEKGNYLIIPEVSDAVSLTPEGRFALINSSKSKLILLDFENGSVIKNLGDREYWVTAPYSVNVISMTPDAKYAVSNHISHSMALYNLKTGKTVKILNGHKDDIQAVRVSANGKHAISCSSDKTIILWDLDSGSILKLLKEHKYRVTHLSVTPDMKFAISGSKQDNKLILWDLKTGHILKTLKGERSNAISMTPDGHLAITGCLNNTLYLWNLQTGKIIKTLNGHSRQVNAVSISADGRRAVSSSSDHSLILWNLEAGFDIQIQKPHTFFVTVICTTPDKRFVVSGAKDNKLILWNLKTGQLVNTLEEHTAEIRSIISTPDGHLILSSSKGNLISWDIETGQTINLTSKYTDFRSITPDNHLAISKSWDAIALLNLKTGKIEKILTEHISNSFSIVQDGRYIVSASRDGVLVLVDLVTSNILREVQKGFKQPVCIFPDGHNAVYYSQYGSGSTLGFWNLITGEILQTMIRLYNYAKELKVIQDGRKVICYTNDNNLILWDVKSGQIINNLKGHLNQVLTISLTPDGTRAVSSSEEGTIILWDLERGIKLAYYSSITSIHSIAVHNAGIVLGDEDGQVVFLEMEQKILCPGPGIITARIIWDFTKNKYRSVSGDCPFCGKRFKPNREVIKTIKWILHANKINKEESPCMKLPNEAWEHPGLISYCPNCREKLKFNPFIAGGDNYN